MSLQHYSEPCDSFFVEEPRAPETIMAVDQSPKHRQTISHEERQIMLAENLSTEVAYEYGQEIVCQMIRMELDTIPDVASIDMQPEIEYFMRSFLLDFLIEAHGAFKLLPETLFLAVNLIDRYCSKRVVYARHYQLVGCASLLLAAKYGDKKDRVPLLKELEVMCQSTYTADMIRQMEWHVLSTLDWQIGHSTIDHFIQVQLINVDYDEELEHMALFLAELGLYYRDFISIRSSVMASSALTLARFILGREQPVMDEKPAEQDVVIARLCAYLHLGTNVLLKKYSHPSLSDTVETLRQYLTNQIASFSANPSYAEDAPTFEEYTEITADRMLPPSMQTPHTPPRAVKTAVAVPDDYITPPITPDEAMFADNYMDATGRRDCDMIPSPVHHDMVAAKTEPLRQLEWSQYDPTAFFA